MRAVRLQFGHNKRLTIALVIVAVVLAAAIPLSIRAARTIQARRAVSRYLVALDNALSELNPEALGATAFSREQGRVTSYISLLYSRNVYMESELLDMKVLAVESTDPTVTVTVYEKWRYIERDRRSRKQVSRPTVEENELRYTLLPGRGGRLAVYLSEIVEKDDKSKQGQGSK